MSKVKVDLTSSQIEVILWALSFAFDACDKRLEYPSWTAEEPPRLAVKIPFQNFRKIRRAQEVFEKATKLALKKIK